MSETVKTAASADVRHGLEAKLAHGLGRIAMAARHRSFRDQPGKPLSQLQAQVLIALESAPGLVGELTERLGLTPATVSESVSALAKRGLVSKQQEGRQVTVRLTARGRTLSGRLRGWPEFVSACVSELSAVEQTALLRAVMAMIRQLQRRGVVQDARMCTSCVYFRPNVHAGTAAPHHCEFVNAPLAETSLRLDCNDHREESTAIAEGRWRILTGGKP
ncbi:MAG: MarR family winged helix-turn-helix transcriptional regulator [Myxococcaceae bacterium]